MTNAVFSALPTFNLCTFKMHKTVIKQIDKYRRHCLCRGADINAKSPPKAAWDMYACQSQRGGGLGVLQLQTHNEALRLKNLHKFFNRANIPWVHLVWEKYYRNGKLLNHIMKGSFWWRDILRLLHKFKGLASVIIHRGDTCFLWHDMWGGSVHSQAFLELFSSRAQAITICKATTIEDLALLFNLPIS
jgi:hypothetical protein